MLFSIDGVDYKEQIDARAFEGADMSDVIFNYNHGGKVVARTRNNTLTLWVEADGLHMRARLNGTDEGRKLYEEIKGGYIDRMSFAFRIAESSYNIETHTRTVLRVKKVYDVSAVDIPASAPSAPTSPARISKLKKCRNWQPCAAIHSARSTFLASCGLFVFF